NYAMTENSETTMAQRIANLELSLELDPTNQVSINNCCSVLVEEAIKEAKRGSFTKAIEFLEKAAKVPPENRRTQTGLAAANQNGTPKKGEEGKRPEGTRDPSKRL